jgi:DNA-binding NtrC family response regulator
MQPKNVLVLAEASNAEEICNALEQKGFKVSLAAPTPLILDSVRQSGYDVIVADLSSGSTHESTLPTLEEVERRHIERVLDEVRFNLSRASRVLAIDRTTLYNKLKRFGFQRDSIRARRIAVQSGANGRTKHPEPVEVHASI